MMKNRIFAAIAAAAMLCCTLVSPASAAETYQKGDVNMDGVINIEDAQLVLREYAHAIVGLEKTLTEAQMQLGSITGTSTERLLEDEILPISVADAQVIFNYYCDQLVGKQLPDIETYYEQKFWQG